MNGSILLSAMVASAPPVRQHSSIKTIAPKDHEITQSMRSDDSWRQFNPKHYATPVSRKGGLSNFIPLRTNGVIVLGQLLDGTMATAHITNLEIEQQKHFSPRTKKSKTVKPTTTDLDLDLL